MPDVPVELWTVVCRLLVKPSLPNVVTYQNDLCAVARVSSNANFAVSPYLYDRIHVIDFESLFEGYDHDPGTLRQSKKQSLFTVCSMRVIFSYYDIAPSMGPAVKAVLKGHNHYNRLLGVVPNLSKLQLVATLQGPSTRLPTLKGPGSYLLESEEPSIYDCWSLHALPAQHICQTPNLGRENSFFLRDRPSPHTFLLHSSDPSHRFSFHEPIGNTGGRIIIVFKRPLWSPTTFRHGVSPDSRDTWRRLKYDLSERLGSRIPPRFWDPEHTAFEVYGWLGECLGCSDTFYWQPRPPCTCQAKVRRITRMVQKKEYSVSTRIHEWFEDIPISIKFGLPGELPICAACDE